MAVKNDTYDGEFWCARGTMVDIFSQGETHGKQWWRYFRGKP